MAELIGQRTQGNPAPITVSNINTDTINGEPVSPGGDGYWEKVGKDLILAEYDVKIDGDLEVSGKINGETFPPTIPPGLQLGETSATAYRGDRGKIAYDHSQADHDPLDFWEKNKSGTRIGTGYDVEVTGDLTVDGTINGKDLAKMDTDIGTAISHAIKKDNPHAVTRAQVGLGNVDNTSDANKPISITTQAALNNKVDKVAGKGLSTEDYTTTEKSKLTGIEAGAQKNISPGDGVLTITHSGQTLGSFTANQSSNKSIDIPAGGGGTGSVTGVKGNSESTYRDGNVNLTAANIGALTASDIVTGLNANGNFTKFPDGTMICWISTTVTGTVNTSYGTLFQGTWTWTFPQAFISNPSVSCGRFKWGTSASWPQADGITTTNCILRGIDATSRASGSIQIEAIAIGKWK